MPLPERYARTRFCLWQHRRSHRIPRRDKVAGLCLLSYDTQRFSDTLSDCRSRQYEFPLEGKYQPDRPVKAEIQPEHFSLSISSINYDAPDNVTFYWKLEGFYDDWNRLGEEGHLRFTNLASGDYKLYIRAVSKEEPYLYFEERSIDISIARPVWFSFWAIACYVLLTVLMSVVGFRVMALRKQKKISDEKTRFFVNTAHDIRTPLTLIKAPLEEMLENKTLNEAETNNMHMALRNVNSLLRMTTNLINFERAEVYSPHLYIAEYELNTYIKEIYNNFQTYATIKHITFRYESNFSYMNVWFDKEKMDSILENVISNALKYTPKNGDILISVYDMKSSWRLEVKDNGIGIPAKRNKENCSRCTSVEQMPSTPK